MPSVPHATLRRARRSATVAFALQGFFLVTLLTELPQFKDRYGLDDGVLAGLVLVISLLSALGSVVAERIAVATSSRTAVIAALATISLAGLVIALPLPLGVLAVGLGVYGIGVGAIDAGVNMQAVAVQHAYGRVILSSVYAAWSAGAIVGAGYVAAAESLGLGLTPAVLGAVAIVAVTAGLTAGGLLREGPAAPVDLSLHGDRFPARVFLALGLMMVLLFAVDFGITNWSTLYVHEELATASGTAALAVAVYQLCGLVSRLSADHVIRRLGPTPVASGAAVLAVVGLLLAVVAPSAVVALVGFALAGLGAATMAPLCFSAVGAIAPPGRLDPLIARLNLFNYAGTIVGGAVIGSIGHVAGFRWAFAVPLALAVVMLALSPVFDRAERHHSRGNRRPELSPSS